MASDGRDKGQPWECQLWGQGRAQRNTPGAVVLWIYSLRWISSQSAWDNWCSSAFSPEQMLTNRKRKIWGGLLIFSCAAVWKCLKIDALEVGARLVSYHRQQLSASAVQRLKIQRKHVFRPKSSLFLCKTWNCLWISEQYKPALRGTKSCWFQLGKFLCTVARLGGPGAQKSMDSLTPDVAGSSRVEKQSRVSFLWVPSPAGSSEHPTAVFAGCAHTALCALSPAAPAVSTPLTRWTTPCWPWAMGRRMEFPTGSSRTPGAASGACRGKGQEPLSTQTVWLSRTVHCLH